jgi:hypothetical protein
LKLSDGERLGLTQGWTVCNHCFTFKAGEMPTEAITYVSHGEAWREQTEFEACIENKLTERGGGYDGEDRHEVARRAAAACGTTVLDVYDVLIQVKRARADINAERGIFHADSEQDGCCYNRLKAEYIAGRF